MSRIYFHTPTETVEVLGAERSHAGLFAESLGYAVLEGTVGAEHLADLIGEARSIHPRQLALAIRYADRPLLVHDGREITAWQLILNTAMAVGNDSVKLLARLHAQCELHAWVEGHDRDWFAGLIVDGLDAGILREGMGWDSVVAMLRRSVTSEPVVMSYSVMDSFPNCRATAWVSPTGSGGEEADEEWAYISDEEKWKYGGIWLGQQERRRIQWRPSDWQDMRFGHAVNAFDLDKILREKRSQR